jgi:hypothetical protein
MGLYLIDNVENMGASWPAQGCRDGPSVTPSGRRALDAIFSV